MLRTKRSDKVAGGLVLIENVYIKTGDALDLAVDQDDCRQDPGQSEALICVDNRNRKLAHRTVRIGAEDMNGSDRWIAAPPRQNSAPRQMAMAINVEQSFDD